MQRIKDGFLDKIEETVPLAGLAVLEIGCGDGSRSVTIASRCKNLTAIEPDKEKLREAQSRQISNAVFENSSAEKLPFADKSFDIAIFTLSLHHVLINKMSVAIDEAVRVTKSSGYIIFLEPTENGTFFQSELNFDACDGDERQEKVAAYKTIRNHTGLKQIKEENDETIFQFESVDDFIRSMNPKKNPEKLEEFLKQNKYILSAKRRINIAQPR